jgi:hypothetical protein
MREAGPDRWAIEEFGRNRIVDHRWRRRVAGMAARVARRPAGRVTEVFTDGAERQGAYGLLESDAVGCYEIAAEMFAACARRSAGEAYVLCPIDGTSLTLTDRNYSKDFGPIGTRSAGARGIKVMNAMVLSPHGVPLGISAQQWWTRPVRTRRKHRDSVRSDQKETQRWLDALKQTKDVMATHAPQTRCWFQMDREADAWPLLTEAGRENCWFTTRSSWNRRVRVRGQGGHTYLHEVMAEQPMQDTYELEVRGTAKRRARTAHMVLRACRVTLDLRDKRTSRRFPLDINVVQAVEQGTTPTGEKPISWTLLTNHPIDTTQDLADVVFGYSMRWRIEELHRTWKSGACCVEETQLRSTQAVKKWATILIAVAARIERIKQLSRDEPQRPASDEFSAAEIKATALLRFGKSAKAKVPPNTPPSMADVTLWIAEIGGYTGRTSSGGPPGSIVIARGLEQVRTAAKALDALASD